MHARHFAQCLATESAQNGCCFLSCGLFALLILRSTPQEGSNVLICKYSAQGHRPSLSPGRLIFSWGSVLLVLELCLMSLSPAPHGEMVEGRHLAPHPLYFSRSQGRSDGKERSAWQTARLPLPPTPPLPFLSLLISHRLPQKPVESSNPNSVWCEHHLFLTSSGQMSFCLQSVRLSSHVRGPRGFLKEHSSFCQTLIPLITTLAPPPPISVLSLSGSGSPLWDLDGPFPQLSGPPVPPPLSIPETSQTTPPLPLSLGPLGNLPEGCLLPWRPARPQAHSPLNPAAQVS